MGIPGLSLATPLTACLKVAGDYISELGFLAVLLGDRWASEIITNTIVCYLNSIRVALVHSRFVLR